MVILMQLSVLPNNSENTAVLSNNFYVRIINNDYNGCVLGTCWKVALFVAYCTIRMPTRHTAPNLSFKLVGNVADVGGYRLILYPKHVVLQQD